MIDNKLKLINEIFADRFDNLTLSINSIPTTTNYSISIAIHSKKQIIPEAERILNSILETLKNLKEDKIASEYKAEWTIKIQKADKAIISSNLMNSFRIEFIL